MVLLPIPTQHAASQNACPQRKPGSARTGPIVWHPAAVTDPPHAPRFLLLEDVARELATSNAQVYALVRNGQLPAIKVGGRGQWRIERVKLEEYIPRAYDDTKRWIGEHPFGSAGGDDQGAGGE